MAILRLYRRHLDKCAAGLSDRTQTYESDEMRPKAPKCRCTIYAGGTLGGQFRRHSTGEWRWEEAKAVAAALEAAGRWEGAAPPPTMPAPPDKTDRVTIERAIKDFLDEHERNSARNTVKRYERPLDNLKRYSEAKGYVVLDQLGPVELRDFRSTWTVAPSTARTEMSVIRGFFEFCLCNEWIDRNPGKLVKNPRSRANADPRNEQKLPFSDDELTRMYDVAATRYGKMEIKWLRTNHHERAEGVVNSWRYAWTGKDLADFISVSTFTGMRISDVATFHISRLKENGEVHIRTTKTGALVHTWVPEWLQQAIRRRSLEVGPLIFGDHETTDMNVVTDIWRRKLKRLWRMCEVDGFTWSAPPTPHRFRHSFARILLQRAGVEVRDVAELLGDSEQVVRKHYTAWIPERQERLTAVVRAAFAETPRPDNVVEMPRTGTK